jgi:hypothetical protein
MLVVGGYLVELVLQGSDPGDAVDELQMSLRLVIETCVVDDRPSNRLVDAREISSGTRE